MAITSLDQYIAALKLQLTWIKTAARTTVAAIPFSLFDIAGNPGAGTLAIGNTANGLVHTDAIAGYPVIGAFGGLTGYLSGIDFASTVACRIALYDRLFSAGAYTFNANVTLASQPSFAGRVPNGNYSGLEIWLETVTAFTGSQSIRILYLDQNGASGDTGVIATGVAPTIGRMFRMPLAAGDNGVQRIDQVISSVSTVGTFNVHVMRRLWMGRVPSVGSGDTHDLLKTGMPQVYEDSALFPVVFADGTGSGVPELRMEIAVG